MPRPLSQELRERFKTYIEEGYSARKAAERLKLSAATGVRWAASIRVSGSAKAHRSGRRKGSGKLGSHEALIIEWVTQDPDITLLQLQSALVEATNVFASQAAFSMALKRLGYSHKKNRWSLQKEDA